MTINVDQLLHELMANGLFLPLLAGGGWILRNYLRDKFVSVSDFEAYKEAHDKEKNNYKKFMDEELEEKQKYLMTLDERTQGHATDIAEIKGRLEK